MCHWLSPLPTFTLFIQVLMAIRSYKIEARSILGKTWNTKKVSAKCPKVAEAESTCNSSGPSAAQATLQKPCMAVQ